MLSWDNTQNRVQKIFRMPDGGVAGGCGVWARAYSGLKYLTEGGDPEGRYAPKAADSPPDIEGAQLILLRPDGTVWVVDDEFPAYPLLDTVVAIGCGADAALMAMALGLSAIEAVARVAKQDLLCGDPVQSMKVHATHEYPGAVTHVRKPKRPGP